MLEFNKAVPVLVIVLDGRNKNHIEDWPEIREILCNFFDRDILRHAIDVELVVIVVSLYIGDGVSHFDFLEGLNDLT